jgi:predicted phage replisome organizer
MAERRFYWLKLKEDFFDSKRIKKLRRLAGGDTLTIIYLKMQLKSIKTDGVLTYTGLEKSFAEELALDLDENPEDVGLLLNYLLSVGLIETDDKVNFLLPYAVESTGSEGVSAERMRNARAKQKALPEQSANIVRTKCEHGYVEIEKEIEIDKEKDNNRRSRVFTPPTREEVKAYCQERNKGVNPDKWYDFYESKGWMVGKNKMKDWKASVRTWEEKNKPTEQKKDYRKELEEYFKENGWPTD